MEKNEITRQKSEVIIQDNKEITSDIMLEEIICRAIQIPGVKVDRNKFLAEIFSSKFFVSYFPILEFSQNPDFR